MAGAALIMGVVLFQQREMLKGRTQKLQYAIKQVANTLEAADGSDVKLAIKDAELQTYKQKPGGPAAMDVPLNQFIRAAQDQLGRLNGTRTTLAETKATLAKTEEDLGTTRTNLATAKAEIVTLNDTVKARDATIEEKNTSIKNLEKEKTDLIAEREKLNTEVASLKTGLNDLKDQLEKKDKEIRELRAAKAANPDAKIELTKGQHGKVLYVDPEWNFLVIGLSSEESRNNVTANLEFLIHREDKLVGKVRVKSIESNMVIADIVNDFMTLLPQKGDFVMY
jgi:chromosome segregation ATPase